jgi:hypothetical protein
MNKVACYIFSYDITKGMKSIGPKGLLKSNKSTELINCQIQSIKDSCVDINVIVGFGAEKLKKRIADAHSDCCIKTINNDLYETANHGYALELIFNDYDHATYDGCIIINDGILFNSKTKKILLNSQTISSPKIIYIQSDNKNKKDTFHIGCSITEKDCIQHMFFDLTNNLWTEIVYFDNRTFGEVANIYSQNMRNMFLFEIINKSIDLGIEYNATKIKTSDILKINGARDSNKIKETT